MPVGELWEGVALVHVAWNFFPLTLIILKPHHVLASFTTSSKLEV